MGCKPLEGSKKNDVMCLIFEKVHSGNKWHRDVWTAFSITQVREDGGLDLSGGCLSEKKWLDLWYIWKVELTAFADGWVRSMRESEKSRMTPRLLELEEGMQLPLMGTAKTTKELLISSLLTPTHWGFPTIQSIPTGWNLQNGEITSIQFISNS